MALLLPQVFKFERKGKPTTFKVGNVEFVLVYGSTVSIHTLAIVHTQTLGNTKIIHKFLCVIAALHAYFHVLIRILSF